MAAGSHVAYPVVSKARSRAVSLAGIAISRSLMKLWGIDRFGTDRANPVLMASGPNPN